MLKPLRMRARNEKQPETRIFSECREELGGLQKDNGGRRYVKMNSLSEKLGFCRKE